MTIRTLSRAQVEEPVEGTNRCEHRSVSKDGRIVCDKIVEGDNRVSPDVCGICPFEAVNCAHLRFSLRQVLPSPLIVRYNGRTEIWDDDPPQLCFEHAACAARVIPIDNPRICAGCSLRQSVERAADRAVERAVERPVRRRATRGAAVVPFPQREVAAAAG